MKLTQELENQKFKQIHRILEHPTGSNIQGEILDILIPKNAKKLELIQKPFYLSLKI